MKAIKRILCLVSFVFVLFSSSVVFSADPVKSQMPAPNMVAETVNINSSDAQTMAAVLNGIGIKRAEAIVAYRNTHGEFKSIEELKAVRGVGDSIIEKNKNKILL